MSVIRRVLSIAASRAPARPLALARIGAAAAILLEIPNTAGTLLRLTDQTVIQAPYLPVARMSEPMAWLLIGLWLVGGVMLLVGWHTRYGGGMLIVALTAALLSDQQTYSNHLYLMLLVAVLLTVAGSGAALSFDARRVGGVDWVPGWPVWLLCVQVSIVYGFAALAKLNPDFLSGSVVASSLRRDGLLALPEFWRSFQPALLLSMAAISSEAFLAFALWVPRWRPAGMVVGLGLHLFIAGWLSPTVPLAVFSLLSLPLYLLFLDAIPQGRVVVWDDGCGFCATWVRWFGRLDWMHALRFVPRSQLAGANLPITEDAAARALQIVLPKGAVRGGFAAVTAVGEILPVSYLWAPILRLPPFAAVGEAAYRRVAARRSCELPVAARAASESRSS